MMNNKQKKEFALGKEQTHKKDYKDNKSNVNNTFEDFKAKDPDGNAQNAVNATNAGSRCRLIGEATALPLDIYHRLPEGFASMCNAIKNDNQKDVFLLSALTVLSAHMPNVYMDHSTGVIHPQLFIMIIAPSASGKGIANQAKNLGKPLQDMLYKKLKDGRSGLNTTTYKNRTRQEEGPKAFFIPANSSDRAFFDRLYENEGRGLVMETEIDTLLNAMEKEWGNYSDVILKGFHHEAVSINRKDAFLYIEKPNFSICITGTPIQFNKMFKNYENGLLSRFGLYTFEATDEWESHIPKRVGTSLQKEVTKNAEMLKRIFIELDELSSPLEFHISEESWKFIDSIFEAINSEIINRKLPDLLLSYNRRALINALRIACALAVYRHFKKDEKVTPGMSITPDENDIYVGVEVSKMFVNHANHLIDFLPCLSSLSNSTQKFRDFYEALPNEFATSEAEEIARDLKIPDRTFRNWLSKYKAEFIRIKQGHYRKRK